MGQPELRDRLNDHGLRQLRQRITVRYHLNPLTRRRNRPIHAASPPGFRGQRRALFHPACPLAHLPIQQGHPAPDQRRLRQMPSGRLRRATRAKSISAWSAAPGGNWKGSSIYEPDQRRPEARQPNRSRTPASVPVPARVSVEPVDDPRGKFLAMAMVAGSVLALALAAWFFWQLLFASHSRATSGAETAQVEPPASAPQPVASESPTPPAAVMTSPSPATVPAPTPAPAPAPDRRPNQSRQPGRLT